MSPGITRRRTRSLRLISSLSTTAPEKETEKMSPSTEARQLSQAWTQRTSSKRPQMSLRNFSSTQPTRSSSKMWSSSSQGKTSKNSSPHPNQPTRSTLAARISTLASLCSIMALRLTSKRWTRIQTSALRSSITDIWTRSKNEPVIWKDASCRHKESSHLWSEDRNSSKHSRRCKESPAMRSNPRLACLFCLKIQKSQAHSMQETLTTYQGSSQRSRLSKGQFWELTGIFTITDYAIKVALLRIPQLRNCEHPRLSYTLNRSYPKSKTSTLTFRQGSNRSTMTKVELRTAQSSRAITVERTPTRRIDPWSIKDKSLTKVSMKIHCNLLNPKALSTSGQVALQKSGSRSTVSTWDRRPRVEQTRFKVTSGAI